MNLDRSSFQSSRKIFRDYQYVVKYKAKKVIKVLMIVFEIPLKIVHYSNKSIQYIFELFKYNGPNSFIRTLKEKDLIYSFDSYVAQ